MTTTDKINSVITDYDAARKQFAEDLIALVKVHDEQVQAITDRLTEVRKEYAAMHETVRGIGEGLELVISEDDDEFSWELRDSGNHAVLADRSYKTKPARDHAVERLFPGIEHVDG